MKIVFEEEAVAHRCSRVKLYPYYGVVYALELSKGAEMTLLMITHLSKQDV